MADVETSVRRIGAPYSPAANIILVLRALIYGGVWQPLEAFARVTRASGLGFAHACGVWVPPRLPHHILRDRHNNGNLDLRRTVP